MTPISLRVQFDASNSAYYGKAFGSLRCKRKKLIRGFRSAILIAIWAFTLAGLADACLALEQIPGPRLGTGSIIAPGTPNSAAGPRGQLGITNKSGASIPPGDGQHINDCAAAAAGGKGTDCPPAKAAKGIVTPGGGEAAPAPTRKPAPCIGYPDRQCL